MKGYEHYMVNVGGSNCTFIGYFYYYYFKLESNLLCFLSESLEDKCQKMACECDREAAKCFSKAPYHTKYLLWPDIMCGEVQPLCRY